MKNRSIFAASIIILAPAVAAASQPARTPPSQNATQPQTSTAQPSQTCDETGKPVTKSATAKGSSAGGADASAGASDSVKAVQKNTGDHPTRTKTAPSKYETVCATQPQ
jgi:hypothetical protein